MKVPDQQEAPFLDGTWVGNDASVVQYVHQDAGNLNSVPFVHEPDGRRVEFVVLAVVVMVVVEAVAEVSIDCLCSAEVEVAVIVWGLRTWALRTGEVKVVVEQSAAAIVSD